jgi:hypothetical protein
MHRFLWIMVGLILVPMMSLAIWQVADPLHGTKYHYLHSLRILRTDYPRRYANGSKFLFKLRKGSLKDNVYRLANKYNWRVTWRARGNYHVMLNTEIVGVTFQVAMDRLLSHYPLRATYNAKHKSMMVRKR